ncbi:MAG: hypothetical protein FWF69_07785 [Firmicutes bacterium]|nr:hypothetical protein [Bacillota bacterium]
MGMNIGIAGISGLAMSALQLLLTRGISLACAKELRLVLMLLKLPLWTLAFVGVALWWGAGPLIAFGAAAGLSYLTVTIVLFSRSRKGE